MPATAAQYPRPPEGVCGNGGRRQLVAAVCAKTVRRMTVYILFLFLGSGFVSYFFCWCFSCCDSGAFFLSPLTGGQGCGRVVVPTPNGTCRYCTVPQVGDYRCPAPTGYLQFGG